MMPSFTIQQFNRRFPTNEACLEDLFQRLHKDATCAACGQKDKYYLQKGTAHYVCSCGGSQISPKNGTIFHKSETDLVKWYFAIFLMSQSRNGVAALELQRHIGVKHYQTALRMTRMIRSMMDENADKLFGDVEADETVVGGKRKGKRGRGAEGKTIVFGAIQRKGKMNTAVVPDVKAATLLPHFQSHIAKGTRMMTDEMNSYHKITDLLDLKHDTVSHSKGEYAKGDVHTNTIEGFWSQLKRSIDGTHHVVSPKHLASYVREYAWKWNHKDDGRHFFDLLLERVSLPPKPAL